MKNISEAGLWVYTKRKGTGVVCYTVTQINTVLITDEHHEWFCA